MTTQTVAKPRGGVVTPLKQPVQSDVIQNNGVCGSQCTICQQPGGGTCSLNTGHTTEHQCNVNSSHRWTGDIIPGPHYP